MPRVRRTAAALAVVLATAACTSGRDGDAPTPGNGTDGAGPGLLGTVDLDAAVDGDARWRRRAPGPPVAGARPSRGPPAGPVTVRAAPRTG